MARKVEVVPYDPSWPVLFQSEAGQLAAILGEEVVAIHHVGSTAIAGMSAKPTVDILVEVHHIAKIDGLSNAMRNLGYKPKGEFGIPGRRFFSKTATLSEPTTFMYFKSRISKLFAISTFGII